MILIAEAVREATAALDAAVTAACSSTATPRSATLPVSGMPAGEQTCRTSQQAQASPVSSNGVTSAAGLAKGMAHLTLHSTLIGDADQWNQQPWRPQQQQSSHGIALGSASVSRPAALARFSSFQGSREPGSRQTAQAATKTIVQNSTNNSTYINSLLQQCQARNAVGAREAVAGADGAPWGRMLVAPGEGHQGLQRSHCKGIAGRLGTLAEGRHAVTQGIGAVLTPSSNTVAAADGLAGAVVLGSGIRSGAQLGQRHLLRHCSTSGLLGKLRLAETCSPCVADT
jgi:hypothetical protein